jgi:hypothetical protein
MRSKVHVGCVSILTVLAFYFLVWPIWRAQFPTEIWLTESWNAFHQDAAIAGLPLYPGADQLIVNNYPPLSFYAVGALAKVFGDALYVGRVLSLVGLIAVAIEIGLIVRMLVGSTVAGAIGALWFVALMAHNATHYVGANDPQIAGHAIMGAGLAWFIARDRVGRSQTLPLLLMILAGFWKHNIIAMPVTAVMWLMLRDWRSAARPVTISMLAAGAGLAMCGVIFGGAFYTNLLTSRAYSMGHLVSQLGALQWLAVAAIGWGIWAWYSRGSYASRFTALHVLVGFVTCLAQWLGDGVFGNAAFDLTIALAIGVGCTYAQMSVSPIAARIGANPARVMLIMLLALRLVASSRQESAAVLFNPQFRVDYAARAAEMTAAAVVVSRMPGQVYCRLNNLVCRAGGKAFVVDDFKTDQLLATGNATAHDIDEMFKARGITVIDKLPPSS